MSEKQQELKQILVSAEELARLLSVSTVTIYDWVRKGKLPQPIRFGRRCSRWRLSEVEAAIDRLAQQGDE